MPGHRHPHARPRRLRGRAARLRRLPREAAHAAPSSVTSRRPTPPPHRHLVEFRDEAGELQVGETVTVEVFEPGQKVKISGTSKGKGFQGTIKRHRFAAGPKSHGSHNVRAPGSIGASAWPARVMKGIRGPGQMGNKRITQKGLEVVEVIAQRQSAARPRRRSRPARRHGGGAHRCLEAPKHRRRRRRRSTTRSSRSKFNGPLVHEVVRAELNALRQGTAATKTRGNVRGGGAKPWRQKGTGRARAGSSRSPHLEGRRHRLRSEPAPLHLQGQPQGPPRRAAQRAVGPRRPRLDRRLRRGRVRRRRRRKQAVAAAARLGSAARDARAARRGRGRRRPLVPQPRGACSSCRWRTPASPT